MIEVPSCSVMLLMHREKKWHLVFEYILLEASLRSLLKMKKAHRQIQQDPSTENVLNKEICCSGSTNPRPQFSSPLSMAWVAVRDSRPTESATATATDSGNPWQSLVILNAVNDLNAADVCCFATKGPTKNLKKTCLITIPFEKRKHRAQGVQIQNLYKSRKLCC